MTTFQKKITGAKCPVALLCWIVAVGMVVAGIGGCGGGTSGTGLTTYQGVVTNSDGTPSSGTTVTLVQNHESSVTGADGSFQILTPPLAEPGTLIVNTGDTTESFQLKSNPQEGEQVRVSITIGEEGGTPSIAEELEMSAKIAGRCDSYFENNQVIRQANHTPEGVTCTLKVKISANGQPQGGIPVAIQSRACEPRALWVNEESGVTESGVHQGVLQLRFHFYSSIEKCQYRVVAPFDVVGVDPIVTKFQTFAETKFD